MNKIQNIIKHVGVIYFAAGPITACSEYNVNRLQIDGNEYRARTDSGRKFIYTQLCNSCGSLYKAARNGHESCTRVFFGANGNAYTHNRKELNTALIFASKYGNEACVNALIGAGADVYARGYYGYTVLVWEAINLHEACANALIEAGMIWMPSFL